MKYLQIVQATPALDNLRKLNLPYAKARDIHRLYKKLEAEFVFFAEEETKLVKEYASKTKSGEPLVSETGKITFDSIEKRNAYLGGMTKLKALESDVQITPIIINGCEIGDQNISAEIIDKLDGIIIFE